MASDFIASLYRYTADTYSLIETSTGAEIDLATQNVMQYMQWFANFTIVAT